MVGAAIAEDAKQDTVQVHGKSLVLSCAEWKRNEDGSWTSTTVAPSSRWASKYHHSYRPFSVPMR